MEKEVFIRRVETLEYYEKMGKKVFRFWKFNGEKNWRKEKTPFKEIPWVKADFTQKIEPTPKR